MRRTSGRPLIIRGGDEVNAPENADGVRVLEQDFEIPEGTMPIRMQTGDLPVTIVGWIASAEDLPDLLEDVARELREILAS